MEKKLLLISIIIGLLLLSSFVVAKGQNWYDKQKPSDNVDPVVETNLINKQVYVWNTTQYWKDGNCYYYDLYIGNSTNSTWQDTHREIECGKILTDAEIEDKQLANVAWTLQQLGAVEQVVTQVTKTDSKKGEDLKNKKVMNNDIVTEQIKFVADPQDGEKI